MCGNLGIKLEFNTIKENCKNICIDELINLCRENKKIIKSNMKYKNKLSDCNYKKAKFCINNIDTDYKFLYLKTTDTFIDTDLCSDKFNKGVLKFSF